MTEIILFHGTSEANAKKIMKEGFRPDLKYNWDVKSKKGFVYLSKAYAPFYAERSTRSEKLALIKVSIDTQDAYPEDDFVMLASGKRKYTQKELDVVDLEEKKPDWEKSLKFMGNVAAHPDKVKILGVRYFDRDGLLMKSDPAITPENFAIMGSYYEKLSEWIFEGKKIMNFPSFIEMAMGMKHDEIMKKLKGVI